MLNQIDFQEEDPIAVIAIDDSASLLATQDSIELIEKIEELAEALTDNGLAVRLKGTSQYYESAEQIAFTEQTTNLNGLLSDIAKDFEQQHMVANILLSDGIHNYGSSPQFFNSTIPIYSIGLGDTIPAKDLSIKRVNTNKVVYQGKQFPLEVDIFNNGFVGQNLTVQVISEGKTLASQSLRPTGDQQINTVSFVLDPGDIGIKAYQIQLVPQTDESTRANNVRRAFVEVIDSQQKILIAASAPHPDIKVLRNIIESKEGTEVSLWIQTLTKDFPEGPFDLVIYHELPGFNDLPEQIDHWIDDGNTLFITGTEELSNINERNPVLSYNNMGRTDQVSANYSNSFDLFDLEEELVNRFSDYPPITVPYGTFSLKDNAIVLLYQRIGNAQTNRPLISIINSDNKKSAVFSGSGLWKWQLQESALYGQPELFEELFGKLIQFLATTENKTNFEVSPTEENYTEAEPVEFVTKVYNELYEPVYDYNISLKLKNEANEIEEYNYANSPNNDFSINGLPPGIYTYEASVRLNSQVKVSNGSFTIEELALEDIDVTANHQLLRNISSNSGGRFVKQENIAQIVDEIKSKAPKPITRSSQALSPLINNPLFLILIASLLALEWFTRKYQGFY